MALTPFTVISENAGKFRSKITQAVKSTPLVRRVAPVSPIQQHITSHAVPEPHVPPSAPSVSEGSPRIKLPGRFTGESSPNLGSLDSSVGSADPPTKRGVLGSLESTAAKFRERLKAVRGEHLSTAKSIKLEADIFMGEAGPLVRQLNKQVDQAFNTYADNVKPRLSQLDEALQAKAQRLSDKQGEISTLENIAMTRERERLQNVPDSQWPHWARRERRISSVNRAKNELEIRRREALSRWAELQQSGRITPTDPELLRSNASGGTPGLAVHHLGYQSYDLLKGTTPLENAQVVRGMVGGEHTLCATSKPLSNSGVGLVIRGPITEKMANGYHDGSSIRFASGERVAHPAMRARQHENWTEAWIKPKEIVAVVPGHNEAESKEMAKMLGVPLGNTNYEDLWGLDGLVTPDERRQLMREHKTFKTYRPSLSEIMGFQSSAKPTLGLIPEPIQGSLGSAHSPVDVW